MIKKFSLCMIMALLLLTVSSAHSGRTDGRGGHYDSATGEYHYHHGYRAHQHTDLDGDGKADCPYNFDDQTGARSGTSSSKSTNASAASSTQAAEKDAANVLQRAQEYMNGIELMNEAIVDNITDRNKKILKKLTKKG